VMMAKEKARVVVVGCSKEDKKKPDSGSHLVQARSI
jgi:hypothetical protein